MAMTNAGTMEAYGYAFCRHNITHTCMCVCMRDVCENNLQRIVIIVTNNGLRYAIMIHPHHLVGI